MKTILLLWITLSPLTAPAQKAYERVTYTGKTAILLIKLTYADGYLAASEIKTLDQKTKATSKFMPELGTPDEMLQLVFNRSGGNKQTNLNDQFILDGIDETTEAPAKIKGRYLVKGKFYNFTLIRK